MGYDMIKVHKDLLLKIHYITQMLKSVPREPYLPGRVVSKALQKNSLQIYDNIISMPWALAFFLLEHLFCLSHYKTRWSMSVNYVGIKICLLGTSTFMVTSTSFLWCKPKWSHDEFNNQSTLLHGLGTVHDPWCKQPLSPGSMINMIVSAQHH